MKKADMTKNEEIFWHWLVKLLPEKLIFFCAVHVLAYATSEKYSSTIITNISGMRAIKRYGDDKGI